MFQKVRDFFALLRGSRERRQGTFGDQAAHSAQPKVKICGLKTGEAVHAAVQARADMVGFVFYEKTPRFVTPDDAGMLARRVPVTVKKVGLFVDPSDQELAAVARRNVIDMVQLHGQETPERVRHVKRLFRLPVMKAIPVRTAEDLAGVAAYAAVSDYLLFDAKPPADASRPGGNAETFDWTLLAGKAWSVPWLLAGGLTPENVSQAVAISGAPGVDVSSGVEDAPGEKSPDKILAFITAAKAL